jgi:predicted ester cyclase
MSSADEIRSRFIPAVAANEVAKVVACYRDDAVLIAPEGRFEGRDYIEAFYRGQFQAFPGARLMVTLTHDRGDTGIAEWSFTGTNNGPLELPGGEVIAPTGKRVTQRGVDIAIIEDGLIREHRLYYDQLELIEQLGPQAALRG